mgnify:CR=1 FL=1
MLFRAVLVALTVLAAAVPGVTAAEGQHHRWSRDQRFAIGKRTINIQLKLARMRVGRVSANDALTIDQIGLDRDAIGIANQIFGTG